MRVEHYLISILTSNSHRGSSHKKASNIKWHSGLFTISPREDFQRGLTPGRALGKSKRVRNGFFDVMGKCQEVGEFAFRPKSELSLLKKKRIFPSMRTRTYCHCISFTGHCQAFDWNLIYSKTELSYPSRFTRHPGWMGLFPAIFQRLIHGCDFQNDRMHACLRAC